MVAHRCLSAFLSPRLDKLAEKFKAYLKACAPDEAYQAAQLIALERLCGLSLPARVKEVALVMKVLYEYDIVGDETFEQWEGSGDIVRKFKIPAEGESEHLAGTVCVAVSIRHGASVGEVRVHRWDCGACRCVRR